VQTDVPGQRMVIVLAASPRADGNSMLMAQAAAEGVREAGHAADVAWLPDHIDAHLGDCRSCRRPDGRCSISDGYEALLRDRVAAADGVVFATPLHWYGPSGRLKTFIDRLHCHTSPAHPDHARIKPGLMHRRHGLLISAEESFQGALPLILAFKELARYLHCELAGYVVGSGNTRGEVVRDPSDPLERSRELGRELFTRRVADLRTDTVRPHEVWPREAAAGG
jgi:multimeric flavodoxin WrbA